MFGHRKHAPPQKRIDSLIGAGTVVRGDVVFCGGLRINGSVCGPVEANDYLELQGKATHRRRRRLSQTRRLEMHLGAVVEGRLNHAEPESASVVEFKRATGD